jgi:GPH family glycoside/pentoside/hexuronide:cation symporter
MSIERLSYRTKLAYALPAFSLAVVGIPVYVYIPKFYTDVIGVPMTALGVVLLAVRLFDAVTDPLIGSLSDRTRSPFGRRRPFIIAGAVLTAAAMLFLFNPPDGEPLFSTIWFSAGMFALFLFWTTVTVPYESLGPEMTFDYNDRTALFAVRDGFLIAGTLAAASAPVVADSLLALGGGAGERGKFFWISVVYAPLLVGSCLWCCQVVREAPRTATDVHRDLLKGIGSVRRNRPFVILLLAYTIASVGSNLPASLILYYVEYVIGSPLADLFLMIYFVTGIAFMPVWIVLSRRAGKKRAWLTAIFINTAAFFGVFFLGPGDARAYGVLVFLSGIGFGGALALPSSIQSDVIDYDELLTGRRREGLYIGLWSVAKKFAAAVGVGTGLTVLGMAGFAPNAVQPEGVQWTLRVLYALVPSLCNIVAFAVAMAYPIDQAAHESIRAGIDELRENRPVRDPLTNAWLHTAASEETHGMDRDAECLQC